MAKENFSNYFGNFCYLWFIWGCTIIISNKQHGRGYSQHISTTSKYILFVILLTCFIQTGYSQQQQYQNTPPVMYLDRNWRISENEKTDTIIARVKAIDAEGDTLEFGLEPTDQGFRIDPNTGVVYLNESLKGRGGDNFFLYVTVSDGQVTAKNEVYVNIQNGNPNKFTDVYSPNTPSFTPHSSNLSQILPPFYKLPGVTAVRQQSPSNTNILNDTNLPSQPPMPPYFQKNTFINRNENSSIVNKTSEIQNSTNNGNKNTGNLGGENNGSVDKTILIPVDSNNHHPNYQVHTYPARLPTDSSLPQQMDNIQTTQSTASSSPPSLLSSMTSIQQTESSPPPSSSPNENPMKTSDISETAITTTKTTATTKTQSSIETTANLNKTNLPIIIIVCGIIIVSFVLILLGYYFRRHLCAFGKSLKKKSKEEMAKQSNQSQISNSMTMTEDSRNSMVMQNWNGPMAFSNRYVPWDRDNPHGQATSQLSTSSSMENPQMKSDRWEFPRYRLKFFNVLGQGAFGLVWRCEAIDIDGTLGVTTVAVKTLKENATEVERNDLYSELKVMKSLEPHVNVVRLLGCCTEKEPIFVILEYVNRGKLQDYLRNSRAERHYGNTHGKSNILTSGELTSFMYQVAKGMDYLSSRGIIHRDLAARNILITDDHVCKVADFGFARDVIASKIYQRKSEGKLPIRWMATESLFDDIFSVKSDIWSFGILMWEIVTLGSTPYPGIAAADVMRKVRDGYRLEKPEHCRRELYNIMYYCWTNNYNERPTFSELVHSLDKLLLTEMDYIELERFPDHNYYNMLSLSGEKL